MNHSDCRIGAKNCTNGDRRKQLTTRRRCLMNIKHVSSVSQKSVCLSLIFKYLDCLPATVVLAKDSYWRTKMRGEGTRAGIRKHPVRLLISSTARAALERTRWMIQIRLFQSSFISCAVSIAERDPQSSSADDGERLIRPRFDRELARISHHRSVHQYDTISAYSPNGRRCYCPWSVCSQFEATRKIESKGLFEEAA